MTIDVNSKFIFSRTSNNIHHQHALVEQRQQQATRSLQFSFTDTTWRMEQKSIDRFCKTFFSCFTHCAAGGGDDESNNNVGLQGIIRLKFMLTEQY